VSGPCHADGERVGRLEADTFNAVATAAAASKGNAVYASRLLLLELGLRLIVGPVKDPSGNASGVCREDGCHHSSTCSWRGQFDLPPGRNADTKI